MPADQSVTITAGKPQFNRAFLIVALACWSIVIAGWIVFLSFGLRPTPHERDLGDAATAIYAIVGTFLLLAIGLLSLIMGGIDLALHSRQYRRDLRSLADSTPISSSQQ